MFYKQEVFLSLMEDTHSMAFVTGRCCVLDYNDYCSREWQGWGRGGRRLSVFYWYIYGRP